MTKTLEQQIEDLKAQLAFRDKLYDNLRLQVATLQSRNSKLLSHNVRISGSNTQLKLDVHNLRENIDRLSSENSKLLRKIRRSTNKNN